MRTKPLSIHCNERPFYSFFVVIMANANVKVKTLPGYNSGLEHQIASNSLVLDTADLVSLSSGYIAKTGVGETIVGVSATKKTFASDNQTVAQAVATYEPISDELRLQITVDAASLVQADVGKFYDLTASQQVDYSTESATTGQVQCVEVISTTEGIFKVANA